MDDVNNWSSSRSRTIHFGRRHREYESVAEVEGGSNTTTTIPKWKVMWKKLMREKKKMFQRSVHNQHQVPSYDEYTYSQNFDDQGSAADWDQPDILSRSFSVRFADPSTIFQRRL